MIRILGGGWYGCHLAVALKRRGCEVLLVESAPRLFSGASGGNPARLHQGFHYPRSRLTRAACQDHAEDFLAEYGRFTRPIPVNLYAVAAHDSLVDFGTYADTMRSGGLEFLSRDPEEFGLVGCEGVLQTGERHILIDKARAYFEEALADEVVYDAPPLLVDDPRFALTVDCTFCALDAEAVDRYEPCLTVLLAGPTDWAVTIMDGPFPSLYPWDEEQGLCSLTSALWTPLSKTCRSREAAEAMLSETTSPLLQTRINAMFQQMCLFWPEARDRYRIAGHKLTIRAMPKSGADARLVDVVRVGDRAIRVRAGKIDAVFSAERLVLEEAARCS